MPRPVELSVAVVASLAIVNFVAPALSEKNDRSFVAGKL
jgi:hypothetical protein